ncbi:hypothetical protein [Yoonia vestfoldensis]|uniref:hypothetical protein n=1 Tax=Yoonia vestfoldensis TaxID=245188 RepID=UPI00035FDD91|nr:hypothetical protein [Yoonia vestfoldensis]
MIWNRAVSLLCAMALVMVAFAHRPADSGHGLTDPQIASYLALGGSLADLCLSDLPREDGAPHADCPSCTLAKSLALAPADLDASGDLVGSVAQVAIADRATPRGQAPRAPPARGPPFIRLI